MVWTARMIQEKNRKRVSVGHRDTVFGLGPIEVAQFKKSAFHKKEIPVHRRATVQIKNFTRNPKLNDKKGIVKSFDKVDRRWRIELLKEGYTIAAPVQNLVVLDPHIEFVAKYVDAQAAAEEAEHPGLYSDLR